MSESKGTAEADDVPEERLAHAKAGGTSDGTAATPATRGTKRDVREPRGNPISRLVRFFREVVAELRKVIWPTRRELITYTTVVLVFVTVMVAIVAGLDLAFAKGVLAVFGRGGAAAG